MFLILMLLFFFSLPISLLSSICSHFSSNLVQHRGNEFLYEVKYEISGTELLMHFYLASTMAFPRRQVFINFFLTFNVANFDHIFHVFLLIQNIHQIFSSSCLIRNPQKTYCLNVELHGPIFTVWAANDFSPNITWLKAKRSSQVETLYCKATISPSNRQQIFSFTESLQGRSSWRVTSMNHAQLQYLAWYL